MERHVRKKKGREKVHATWRLYFQLQSTILHHTFNNTAMFPTFAYKVIVVLHL